MGKHPQEMSQRWMTNNMHSYYLDSVETSVEVRSSQTKQDILEGHTKELGKGVVVVFVKKKKNLKNNNNGMFLNIQYDIGQNIN